MGMPNIPNVTPSITLTRANALDLLLASIAFEELGLAHILNAEGEKIQSLLGTLPGQTPTIVSIGDLLRIDQSVSRTLRNVIKKEMLLGFKLEDILGLIGPVVCTPETLTFGFTGSLQFFTVPAGVCRVSIQAIGAAGGNSPAATGGAGASVQGTFNVSSGDTLSILVGQQGASQSTGGGGGGSFVWRGNGFSALTLSSLLVAAGGGGGGGIITGGVNASTTENGLSGLGGGGGAGGTNGNGGQGGTDGPAGGAGGGAGILTNGGNGTFVGIPGGQGGIAIIAGAAGGAGTQIGGNGGFGGGGGGSNPAGGGGGGFSGGGGGSSSSADIGGGGGGGGSFNADPTGTETAGVGTSNGSVVITTICC